MSKGKILQEVWDNLPESRRRKIKARAAKRIAERYTLQEIRKEAGLTQARVSEVLDIPQGNVSRLEKNADMLLSTLRGYIEAIGGKLSLTVELPNRTPIALVGLGDLLEQGKNQPHL